MSNTEHEKVAYLIGGGTVLAVSVPSPPGPRIVVRLDCPMHGELVLVLLDLCLVFLPRSRVHPIVEIVCRVCSRGPPGSIDHPAWICMLGLPMQLIA